jgi:hypothetical protein
MLGGATHGFMVLVCNLWLMRFKNITNTPKTPKTPKHVEHFDALPWKKSATILFPHCNMTVGLILS